MAKPIVADAQPEASKVLLLWHKPMVRRLGVALDTAGGPTSRADGTAEGGSFQ